MKILIVRFSSIGDIILSSGLLQAIKKKYPQGEIYFLTKESFKQVVEFLPNIDKILTFKGNFFALVKFAFSLRKYKFDLVFDIHNNVRSNIVTLFLTNKKFVYKKYRKERENILKTKNRDKSLERVFVNYYKMISDEKYLPLLNKTKVTDDFILKGKKYILLVPDANWQTKIWAHYKDLAKWLVSIYGAEYEIVAVGAEKYTDMPEKVIDLRMKTTLKELFAILENASLVITNDTGPMHIANGYGRPLIAFFGPTVPEFGFSPIGEKVIILENNDEKCRPCSLHGNEKCPLLHFKCMKNINLDEVKKTIKDFERDWREVGNERD